MRNAFSEMVVPAIYYVQDKTAGVNKINFC